MRMLTTMLLVSTCLLVLVLFSGCWCVAEGTDILTPKGVRPIESLKVGDQVLSLADDGTTQVGTVMRMQRNTLLSCLRIRLSDGNELRVSQWHPIATRDGWKDAGKLSPGIGVRTINGWVTVSSVERQWGAVNVYDISIEPYQNFIASNVVVHNKSIARALRPDELPGSWVGPTKSNWPSFCRMELRSDGTGVFANSPYDVYRIVQWTNEEYSSPSYSFHAELQSTSINQCRSTATLRGRITSDTIRCRLSFWDAGLWATLMRAEDLTAELQELQEQTAWLLDRTSPDNP